MNTYTETDITEISMNDVEKSYRGATGCACGCGGDYNYATNEAVLAEITKHLKYVNRAIAKGQAEFFGCGVEVMRPSGTSVTRLYFKNGISIDQYMSGRIGRRESIEAVA